MLVACAGERGRAEGAASAPVLVFAASDLRSALAEIARDYRAAGGESVTLVFGSTGDLTTQIANGAPADVFFAANAPAIDALAARGLVVDSTRGVYATGRPALVTPCAPDTATTTAVPGVARPRPRCPAFTLDALATPAARTVAIADPSHAPYGRAPRQALERAGRWARVRPKLILGANTAQAYQFGETGNADAGLVALSLVPPTPRLPHALVDSALHDPLRQTVAVLTMAPHPSATVRFLRHVAGDRGQAVMRRYGFTLPMPPAPDADGRATAR